ncbi:MAG: type II secretion system protein N [Marinobacterium sp.]|nr:type II secretion system protein N [Marinobacterium sp.]
MRTLPRASLRWFRVVLAVLLLYLSLMLSSAPAWLLGTRLPGMQAAEYTGSLWQGAARGVKLGGQTLESVQWQWQFPLGWQLQGQGGQLQFSAHFSPGLAEQQVQQLSATVRLDHQPVASLSASLIRFTGQGCLQADNLHWQLEGAMAQLLAGRAETDGLIYCEDGAFRLDADKLRLAVGLDNYQPVIQQRWLAPEYRQLF